MPTPDKPDKPQLPETGEKDSAAAILLGLLTAALAWFILRKKS
ncbi:MAG: LPXTG cell wall anchor domain-containing protein [Candidatus Nanogingivalis sp.]